MSLAGCEDRTSARLNFLPRDSGVIGDRSPFPKFAIRSLYGRSWVLALVRSLCTVFVFSFEWGLTPSPLILCLYSSWGFRDEFTDRLPRGDESLALPGSKSYELELFKLAVKGSSSEYRSWRPLFSWVGLINSGTCSECDLICLSPPKWFTPEPAEFPVFTMLAEFAWFPSRLSIFTRVNFLASASFFSSSCICFSRIALSGWSRAKTSLSRSPPPSTDPLELDKLWERTKPRAQRRFLSREPFSFDTGVLGSRMCWRPRSLEPLRLIVISELDFSGVICCSVTLFDRALSGLVLGGASRCVSLLKTILLPFGSSIFFQFSPWHNQ